MLSAATRERIDAATAELRSLTKREGVRAAVRVGHGASPTWLSEAEVRGELLQVVGREATMCKKVDDALAFLARAVWLVQTVGPVELQFLWASGLLDSAARGPNGPPRRFLCPLVSPLRQVMPGLCGLRIITVSRLFDAF